MHIHRYTYICIHIAKRALRIAKVMCKTTMRWNDDDEAIAAFLFCFVNAHCCRILHKYWICTHETEASMQIQTPTCTTRTQLLC